VIERAALSTFALIPCNVLLGEFTFSPTLRKGTLNGRVEVEHLPLVPETIAEPAAKDIGKCLSPE
jgi:hypothetical protein